MLGRMDRARRNPGGSASVTQQNHPPVPLDTALAAAMTPVGSPNVRPLSPGHAVGKPVAVSVKQFPNSSAYAQNNERFLTLKFKIYWIYTPI